ncbi:hypothetical protein EVG20_g112, partial [Dentipellis fragilis]
MIEPSTTELGCIRLAGREVDLFKLWTMVYRAGGCPKVSQQHAWHSLLPPFDLPDTFPIPQLNMPSSVAEVLAAIYTRIVYPFEQMYNRGNNRDSQQQRALAAARAQGGQFPQSGSSGLSAPMPGGEMGVQAMMAAAMSHSGGSGPIMPPNSATPIPPMLSRQPSGNSVMSPQQSLGSMTPAEGLPGLNSGSSSHLSGLPIGSVGPQIPPRDDVLPLDGDIDIRKRKFGIEDEAKRVRQKTSEPPDASLSNVDRASSSAPPGNVTPAQAPGSVTQSQTTPQGRAQRRKVEYTPIVRELDTSGGRDLRLLAEEYHRATNRRATRDVNEWGNVDVDLLTMSIRSRISTELSYALTTLTLLSIMRGPNGTGFPIHNCEELVEELLDLLEEIAFGTDEAKHWEDETKIVTHKQLVSKIVEDGSRPFASLDKRQGQKPMELGPTQRPGDIVLAVFNIIRNLSVLAENQEFLASHDRVIGVILKLCALRRKDGELLPASPALSLADLVAIRRDALYLLVNLGPAVRFAPSQAAAASPPTTSVDLARRTFELVSSYIVDPSETVTPVVLIMQSDMVPNGNIKPPPLVDAALEVFTRLGQPDSNRQVISKAVPREWQRQLFEALVHRLPLTDHDFQITTREVWLSYVEKIVMSLYALAFLAPPSLKQELKQDRRLGFSKVMLRLVKKLTINVPGDVRTYFNVAAKRATEALKVLDDGKDSFDTSKSTNGPPLSFGVGYGEVGEDRVERGTGMLGGFQEDVVWGVMMQKEVDDSMFRELESLARVGLDFTSMETSLPIYPRVEPVMANDSPSAPPPTYAQEYPQDDVPPAQPQILIIPTTNSLRFQQGYLGADGERAAIEGELQIKGTDESRWQKLTMELRTAESAYDRDIELAHTEIVLYDAERDAHGPLPASFPFAIPIAPDTPQCIHTPHSSLAHTLTATLYPAESTSPPLTKTLVVHTRRFISHTDTLGIAPITRRIDSPTRVEVEVPRTTFTSVEPVPIYVTIPSPPRELVVDQGLRLRNVKAELVRIVRVRREESEDEVIGSNNDAPMDSDDESDDQGRHGGEAPLGLSLPSHEKQREPSSSTTQPGASARRETRAIYKTVISRSGALCRFHTSLPIRLRFILHQSSPSSSPSSGSRALPAGEFGLLDNDTECASITQNTLLHSVAFRIRIHATFRHMTSHTERTSTISIPITFLPSPAPLPEVEEWVETAYHKKHDRPPTRTVRSDDMDAAPHYEEGQAGPSYLASGAPPPFDDRDAPPSFAEASTSARLPTFLESEREIYVPSGDDSPGTPHAAARNAIEGEGVLFGFPRIGALRRAHGGARPRGHGDAAADARDGHERPERDRACAARPRRARARDAGARLAL